MTAKQQDLQGQAVIITGGAGLLGTQHATAIRAINGVPVVLDIDADKLGAIDGPSYAVDITDEPAMQSVAQSITAEFGVPIGLINNAAIDPKFDSEHAGQTGSRLEWLPLLQWEQELRVGLTGAFLCARIFGKLMADANRGSIINISSDLGVIAPDQRIYHRDDLADGTQPVKPVTYSVIKHGLIGLTRYLATYWAERGVRCNALAPGGIYNDHPAEFVAKLSSRIPMGRMAHRHEYHAAVQFLISDASSYMTGQTLVMDGGRSTW